ncbi:site-specific integrase [Staphylococcus felis]|uniref:Site-specific integrase n=1 Tax=Staphylococcus felis TaxID=46127 RepID=A0A3E0IM06_9STAP|nr:site-specific integrase [Staphylococcus felis]
MGNKPLKLYTKPKYNFWGSVQYKRSLNLFCEYFGEGILIKNITRSEYQKFLNNFGEGRADETVRKVIGCLSQYFRDAIYDDYLKKYPSYNVDIKGTNKAKDESTKFMTIKQYIDMIEYFKSRNEMSYIFLYILAITGARYSDVINMIELDLNEKDGLIHLRGTKTANADRFVEVTQKDVQLIKYKISKLPKRLDGKIFSLSHNAVKKSFNHTKKQIVLKDDGITPYALRHTHTPYLLSKGIPIEYISKRLCHYNISITLNVYSHLLDEHKKEQAQRVRELFS